eukprot:RCo042949
MGADSVLWQICPRIASRSQGGQRSERPQRRVQTEGNAPWAKPRFGLVRERHAFRTCREVGFPGSAQKCPISMDAWAQLLLQARALSGQLYLYFCSFDWFKSPRRRLSS